MPWLMTSFGVYADREMTGGVSIARLTPRGWTGPVYKAVAPSMDLLTSFRRGAVDAIEYARLYRVDVLHPLDPRGVHKAILEAVEGHYEVPRGERPPTPVLLCYCVPGIFGRDPDGPCHRELLANWFMSTLGFEITEV